MPRAGYPIEFIEVVGLKRAGLLGLVKGLLKLPRSLWQSIKIVRRYKPGVTIAVGGYASGPVALASWLLRVPVVVQEQNALPGFTSKTVGRFARRVFVAFDEAGQYFSPKKVVKTGNPIRQALLENFLRPAESDRTTRQVFVFGGSQGARALNEAMMVAFPLIRARVPNARLLHQTGEADRERVAAAYEEAGVADAVEVTEFIHGMADAYGQSDVVVCRAGATTLAELAICKKPSILVPFPYAADNHQEVNARAMSDSGAAVLMRQSELTPESLTDAVVGILEDPDRRQSMENAAGKHGHPEAAKEIADVCVDLWMETGGFEREQRALAAKGER